MAGQVIISDDDIEFVYPDELEEGEEAYVDPYSDPDLEDFIEGEEDDYITFSSSDDQSHFSGDQDVFFVDMDTAHIVDADNTAGKNVCVYVDRLLGLEKIKQDVMGWLSTLDWVSYDIETFHPNFQPFAKNEQPWWLKDMVGAFSLSDGTSTYVFKVNNGALADGIEWEHLEDIVKAAFNLGVVGHNLKFDLRFTYRQFKILPRACFDTFLAAKIIHGERKIFYGLKDVAGRILKIKMSKEMQLSNWGGMVFSPQQVAYSGRDTWITARLVPPMVAKMDADPKYHSTNTKSIFTEIFRVRNKVAHLEFYLLPHLLMMEVAGFGIDSQAVDAAYHRLRVLETNLRKAFFEATYPRVVNPNSPAKILAYFRNDLRHINYVRPDNSVLWLRDIKNSKLEEVQEFVNKGFPIIDTYYAFKSTTGNIKRIEEFYACKDEKTDRLYTSFKQWGAISGRTSCPKPNLQNIKNKEKHGINLRHMFRAKPGYKYVVVDYAQIQLVIIAEISQDPVMRSIINNPEKIDNPSYPYMDLHIASAARINEISPNLVTSALRKEAKAANFGLCTRGNTLITTDSGVFPIKDLTVGTRVLTHRGNWKTVSHKYERPLQDFYRITTRSGKQVECSKEHMWLCHFPSANGKAGGQGWVETRDLSVGMYLCPSNHEWLHSTQPVFVSDNLAYIFGRLVGDGYMRDEAVFCVAEHNSEQASINYLTSKLSVLGIPFTTHPLTKSAMDGHQNIEFRFQSPELVEFVKAYGVVLGTPDNRRCYVFPDSLLKRLTKQEKLQILAGLWDADGSIYLVKETKLGVSLYSVCKAIIDFTETLLTSLGLNTKVYYYPDSRNTYILRVVGSTSFRKFMDSVKGYKTSKILYKPKKTFHSEEQIEKIEQFSVPTETVYDITVADDHSFIANGLVSHNCFGMGATKFQDFVRKSYNLFYTEERCIDIRNKYFALYTGVKRWHQVTGRKEKGGKYHVESLYGRRMIADQFTKATNFPVQATEKDIVAFAMCFIMDRFKKEGLDATLVNMVHDELVSEAREDHAERTLQIMQEEMVRAGQLILKTVKVVAEGHIADYWDDAKG